MSEWISSIDSLPAPGQEIWGYVYDSAVPKRQYEAIKKFTVHAMDKDVVLPYYDQPVYAQSQSTMPINFYNGSILERGHYEQTITAWLPIDSIASPRMPQELLDCYKEYEDMWVRLWERIIKNNE